MTSSSSRKSGWRGRKAHLALPAPAVLLISYAMCIIIGASALRLPIASRDPVSWLEAFFTATSAVTVTGLTLFDTGSHFSVFGQGVIMVLIQLGGLGLMTFSVFILAALGLPVGLPHQHLLREDLNQTSIANLVRLVLVIFRVVLVCELVGVIVLSIVFVPEFGWIEGVWQALFHCISAFNNAGFSLFHDSLSKWVANPLINLAVPALFIVGGLGFSVWSDVFHKRSWRRLSLHSKLMLSGTAALIIIPTILIAVLEWGNPGTLGALPGASERLWASWFQAVTTRTAGFNTIDIHEIHDSTSLFMMLLMWIGGGSTSTAGGVKVTTFIILIAATITFFRRKSDLNLFGRRIGPEEVMKVLALTVVSTIILVTGTFVIALSHDGEFLDLAFEIVSALGTVGLSRGATAELDSLGQIVIAIIMFVGRVGPLTLGFFLATRTPPQVRYPPGEIYLG